MRLGLYKLDSIVTGDARELAKALPNGSLDLIFTDPVYDDHSLYEWLAVEAGRLLKPSAPLLLWSNGHWHKRHTDLMESFGFRYRWDFACLIGSKGSPMDGHVIAKTNRLIWLDTDGTSKMTGYLVDGYAGKNWSGPDAKHHKWVKHPRFTAQAIRAFSGEGDVIADFFCGGGTVPAMCKQTGRRFIGFEIDADTARDARREVARTVFTPQLISEPKKEYAQLVMADCV